jgi:hypothetical protein
MVVDVIDIRKRIEKIRNEVSEAIVSRHEFEAHEEALREDINLSVSASEAQPQTDDASELPLLEDEKAEAKTGAPFADPTLATHRAMTQMMSMPSFTLNVKNRHSNRLLIMLFAVQLVTNLVLIMVVLNKL